MTPKPRSSVDLERIEYPQTLAETAYRQIKRHLLTGRFSPGQRFTIRQIASSLAVGFTPTREAIGRLANEGALTAWPRCFVVPLLTIERAEEVYAIRLLLEKELTARAVANATDQDLVHLSINEAEHSMALDRQDFRVALERNYDFHFTIYQLARMPVAVEIVEKLWVQIGPSLNYLYPEFERSREGVKNHENVVNAFRRGDAAAAADAIGIDVLSGLRRIKAGLEKRGEVALVRAAPGSANQGAQVSTEDGGAVNV